MLLLAIRTKSKRGEEVREVLEDAGGAAKDGGLQSTLHRGMAVRRDAWQGLKVSTHTCGRFEVIVKTDCTG
jgi:hypothetical protein